MTARHTSSRSGPPRIPGGNASLPLVALVGRPNVGKSTLFNRLVGQRLAIVYDQPGVTRDRHYADATSFGRRYTLVDTGGFDPHSDDPLRSGIASHVRAAVAEADCIIFLTDGSQPLSPGDRTAVELLRRSEKPVIFAANKVDSPDTADALELYRLGVDRIILVSALHGRGIGELESALLEVLPNMPAVEEPEEVEEEDDDVIDDEIVSDDDTAPDGDAPARPETFPIDTVPRIVIVGRPNAGKSSLLNRLTGKDRMLVGSEPGTTRDAIDTLVEKNGKQYVFVDTAGMRKKGKVTKGGDDIESISVMRSIRAIDRAHVVVLLTDANGEIGEQDAKILGLAEDRGRAIIIVLNKIDLLDRDAEKKAESDMRDLMRFATYAPILHVSAKTGKGVGHLLEVIDQAYKDFTKRVPTGELNRFFAEVLEMHPPPTQGGKAPRLYYVTQAQVAPPTFVAMTSSPDQIKVSYQRYVSAQLRKRFGFEGVPVRVVYRERRRRGNENPAR
jgi:GTP-binding protein